MKEDFSYHIKDSGIHVGQGTNVGHGKFSKNNERRAWKISRINKMCKLKITSLEQI